MAKSKTYVAFIIDRSSSMGGLVEQTVDGYNRQLREIKTGPGDVEYIVSLVTFNHDVYEHIWNQPAKDLNEASCADYHPDGMTAMRDAIGYTLKKLQDTTDSNDKNNAYLVYVISDGEENQSKHFSKEALKEMIGSLQSRDNWTFTYMGCGEEYLKVVHEETAIPLGNMAAWQNTKIGSSVATRAATKRLRGYMDDRNNGVMKCSAFYSEDNGVADYANNIEELTASLDADDAVLNTTAQVDSTVTLDTGPKSGVFGAGASVSWTFSK